MLIHLDDIKVNVLFDEKSFSSENIPIFFLHGFTGSSNDWKFLFNKLPNPFFPFAVDILGHGASSSPEKASNYSTNSLIKQLKGVMDYLNFDQIILVGYSMGGRLALSFCAQYPDSVKALILESSSPGIIEEEKRIERINSDEALIDLIEKEGLIHFIDNWMKIPILNSYRKVSKNEFESITKEKKEGNPDGLINILKGFGSGVMPQLWDSLVNIHKKTLLITGENDEKFTQINSRMDKILCNSQHTIISGSGHITHLEKPEHFIILLCSFLREIK